MRLGLESAACPVGLFMISFLITSENYISWEQLLVLFCRVRMGLHAWILVVKTMMKTLIGKRTMMKTLIGKRTKMIIYQALELTIILWPRMIDIFNLFRKWFGWQSCGCVSQSQVIIMVHVIWSLSRFVLNFYFSLLVSGVCLLLWRVFIAQVKRNLQGHVWNNWKFLFWPIWSLCDPYPEK